MAADIRMCERPACGSATGRRSNGRGPSSGAVRQGLGRREASEGELRSARCGEGAALVALARDGWAAVRRRESSERISGRSRPGGGRPWVEARQGSGPTKATVTERGCFVSPRSTAPRRARRRTSVGYAEAGRGRSSKRIGPPARIQPRAASHVLGAERGPAAGRCSRSRNACTASGGGRADSAHAQNHGADVHGSGPS